MISFDTLFLSIKQFITAIGVVVITGGALRSVYQLFMLVFHKSDIYDIRLDFGKSLMLGLDFIVGADIIGSLIEPNYYNLGLLALLVFIRITLSFFLNRELEQLSFRG